MLHTTYQINVYFCFILNHPKVMKNLLLAIVLFVSVNVSALEIKLHQVSYYHETLGNKSAESKARKTTLDNYKKLGYTFDGMISNSKGKFMKFVK